jgi:hypothetical protein
MDTGLKSKLSMVAERMSLRPTVLAAASRLLQPLSVKQKNADRRSGPAKLAEAGNN